MRFKKIDPGKNGLVAQLNILSSHTPQAHPDTQNVQLPRWGGGNANSVIPTRILHKLKQPLPSCLSERGQPKLTSLQMWTSDLTHFHTNSQKQLRHSNAPFACHFEPLGPTRLLDLCCVISKLHMLIFCVVPRAKLT